MSDLTCSLINARSLANKLPELHCLLYSSQSQSDIYFVTETWLNGTISDGILDPQNLYCILRHDRADHRGGGVCAFIRRNLKMNIIPTTNIHPLIDLIGFDIFIKSEITFRFFLVYRPPNSSPIYNSIDEETYFQNIADFISNDINSRGPTTVLGDLNCHSIDWRLNKPYNNSGSVAALLADFANTSGMSQYVNVPTHDSRILDIVLLNDPLFLHSLSVTSPFSTSDHSTVTFSLFCDIRHDSNCNRERYDWHSADWQRFNEFLFCVDWSQMLSVNLTTDSLWQSFRNVLTQGMALFVPLKTIPDCQKHDKIYPKAIRQLQSKKSCAWREMRQDPLNNTLPEKYRLLSSKLREAIHKYEIEQEMKIIKSDNIGTFYKFVNKKLNHPSGIGVLHDNKNNIVTEDSKKAELLNSYFESMYVEDNGRQPPCPKRIGADIKIRNVEFSPEIIHTIIKNLKSKYTCDPEGFPPILLKKLSPSLTFPLSLIFNSFMSVGKIPLDWKNSIITPIFKKGIPSDPKNYRPVCLTSVFCKLMERVVVRELLSYLSLHNLISKNQHGFLKRLSTCTNLLECMNDWTILIEDGSQVAVAYVDFARAFDSVTHTKLITKLESYGISDILLEWVKFYLSNRKQCTRVGSDTSSYSDIRSGVVQGSCIGPILFVLFINDLVDKLGPNTTAKLYADDLKLYARINNGTDFNHFQRSLDTIFRWSVDWQLNISFHKCFIVILSGNHWHSFNYNSYIFKLGNNLLDYKTSARDLGLTIDSKLNFFDHIADITKKANQRANLLFRSFQSRDPLSLVKAFKIYVRPLLEYNSQIWSPITIANIVKIEQVQRRFTKRIHGCFELTYHQRMKKLDLESLELRRLRADLVFVYKTIFGKTGIVKEDFIIMQNHTERKLRSHQYQFRPVQNLSSARSSRCLFNRVVTLWNSLPSDSTDFSSPKKFIKSIDVNLLLAHCKLNFS